MWLWSHYVSLFHQKTLVTSCKCLPSKDIVALFSMNIYISHWNLGMVAILVLMPEPSEPIVVPKARRMLKINYWYNQWFRKRNQMKKWMIFVYLSFFEWLRKFNANECLFFLYKHTGMQIWPFIKGQPSRVIWSNVSNH